MEFYSAIKNNEILSFAGKWMELENIILSEVTQVQKVRGHMFFLLFMKYGPNINTSNHTKNIPCYRKVTNVRGWVKERLKKVNMVDLLPIKE
jgi:hypothetical protein